MLYEVVFQRYRDRGTSEKSLENTFLHLRVGSRDVWGQITSSRQVNIGSYVCYIFLPLITCNVSSSVQTLDGKQT